METPTHPQHNLKGSVTATVIDMNMILHQHHHPNPTPPTQQPTYQIWRDKKAAQTNPFLDNYLRPPLTNLDNYPKLS